MFEVQIPRQYKYDVNTLFQMIDNTLGIVYTKTLDSKGILTIDATISPSQRLALKNAFLSTFTTYQDLTT